MMPPRIDTQIINDVDVTSAAFIDLSSNWIIDIKKFFLSCKFRASEGETMLSYESLFFSNK